MPKRIAPELKFQKHVGNYLVREHKYGVLEQTDITDTENCIAEDNLWAFLKATQADTLTKLEDDYGTDAREEVFKALRKELKSAPLWMLMRHGLKVRGLEFRLFYPKLALLPARQLRNTSRTESLFGPTFTSAKPTKRLISFSSSTVCRLLRWN